MALETNMPTGNEPMTPAVGATVPPADTKSRVKAEATKLKSEATSRARSAAETGKAKTAETVDGLAQTMHDAAEQLGARTNPKVANYAHQAADALEGFSAKLREKSVDDIVEDTKTFVRRSPAVAIGAAVAIGFVLSRFLKSSGTTPRTKGVHTPNHAANGTGKFDA
jgi:ElaB/YqjD/DUF883 family membrane-anchored ribosome-binding protein